jgi:hypothetical protein
MIRLLMTLVIISLITLVYLIAVVRYYVLLDSEVRDNIRQVIKGDVNE